MVNEEKEGQLLEFAYSKYGEHVVAIRCKGHNKQLFDACKLFMETGTRKEYERIKDEAAVWAKEFVEVYNRGLGERDV